MKCTRKHVYCKRETFSSVLISLEEDPFSGISSFRFHFLSYADIMHDFELISDEDRFLQRPLLLTRINFNLSMDK